MVAHLGDYLGVRLESYYVTGGWRQVAEHLTKSLRSFSRGDRDVIGHYIGIASGSDQYTALKKRVDEKKHLLGIVRMVCVYESSSRHNTVSLEKELISRFGTWGETEQALNTGKGGEGRPPAPGQKHFLYFAFCIGQPDILF